jgi:hypothetical protein
MHRRNYKSELDQVPRERRSKPGLPVESLDLKGLFQHQGGMAVYAGNGADNVKTVSQIQDEHVAPLIAGVGPNGLITIGSAPVVLLLHQFSCDALPPVIRVYATQPTVEMARFTLIPHLVAHNRLVVGSHDCQQPAVFHFLKFLKKLFGGLSGEHPLVQMDYSLQRGFGGKTVVNFVLAFHAAKLAEIPLIFLRYGKKRRRPLERNYYFSGHFLQ